jgi:glycosyltransferase involved in cell wall biosynthesis
MKILFLAQVPPYPPDSGSKIRNYHVLRSLARSHQVTLLAFTRGEDQRVQAERLRGHGIKVVTVPLRRSRWRDALHMLRSLYRREPFLVLRDRSAAMRSQIRQLLDRESYDVLHVDQLTMSQYAGMASKHGVRVVLDAHDVVSEVVERVSRTAPKLSLERWAARLEKARLRDFEAASCKSADMVLAVTERDRATLSALADERTRVHTIPIGVDCSTSTPTSRRPEKNLLFLGTLFYPPNSDAVEWFLREIYPQVRIRVPDVRFVVAGARPSARLRSLARGDSTVDLIGYVSDLAELYSTSAAMVVPVRAGGGMRVKVLEAFANRVPVISTSLGCEGIDAERGRDLLVADTATEFARSVARVLVDPEIGPQLAASARRLVELNYDWRVLVPRLESAYSELVAERG